MSKKKKKKIENNIVEEDLGKFLEENEILKIELSNEQAKNRQVKINDLKSQIDIKNKQLQQTLDQIYRLKNDCFYLEEGLKKIEETHHIELSKNKDFIINLANKYDLPKEYKSGKRFSYDDESYRIILDE